MKVVLRGSLQINSQTQDAQDIFHVLHTKKMGRVIVWELNSGALRNDPRRHALKAVRCGMVLQALNSSDLEAELCGTVYNKYQN